MSILPRSAIHVARVTWGNRGVVLDLIKRDFKLRYVGSLFGGWWNLFHPIVMITIYSVIFSAMLKAKLSGVGGEHKFAYTIYLCAAALPWNAFVEMVSRGTNVFLDNASLIKKVSFPSETLLPIVAGSATITFLISYTLYLGVVVLVDFAIAPTVFLVLYAFALQVLFAMGLSMFLSVLMVFFRDIQQAVAVVFNIWFWLTPIVYVKDLVPERFVWGLYLNPFYYFADVYHHAMFYRSMPGNAEMVGCLVLGVGTYILGASFLCHFKNEIPDEI